MAHDPKWVESGKQHWQRMEDIRSQAKKVHFFTPNANF